jgi:hypothetical protein
MNNSLNKKWLLTGKKYKNIKFCKNRHIIISVKIKQKSFVKIYIWKNKSVKIK